MAPHSVLPFFFVSCFKQFKHYCRWPAFVRSIYSNIGGVKAISHFTLSPSHPLFSASFFNSLSTLIQNRFWHKRRTQMDNFFVLLLAEDACSVSTLPSFCLTNAPCNNIFHYYRHTFKFCCSHPMMISRVFVIGPTTTLVYYLCQQCRLSSSMLGIVQGTRRRAQAKCQLFDYIQMWHPQQKETQ